MHCRNPIYTGLSVLKKFSLKWKWKYRAKIGFGYGWVQGFTHVSRPSPWLSSPDRCPGSLPCQADFLQKVTTQQIQTYLPWASQLSRKLPPLYIVKWTFLQVFLALPGWDAIPIPISGVRLHWSESESCAQPGIVIGLKSSPLPPGGLKVGGQFLRTHEARVPMQAKIKYWQG